MEVFELRFEGKARNLLDYIGESICEYCYGTGEVSVMEAVYPGEPHVAPIGTAVCVCQLSEPDYDNQDE